MENVYLWKVDGRVVAHADQNAAAQLDGLSRVPDKQVTTAQWSAAGGLARVINNKIVLGKTQKEMEDETVRQRIAEIDAEFGELERKMLRPMMAHIKGTATVDDAARLNELDAKTQDLRSERAQKVESLSIPY